MNDKIEQLKNKLSGYNSKIVFNENENVLTVIISGHQGRSYTAHDFRENELEDIDAIVGYIKNYKVLKMETS